jgi:hypothetical protein
MFKEDDGGDLRRELGISDDRADELVNIIEGIMDRESSEGGHGRTSHILLDIAGRKDLDDVEKAACIFIFCCRILEKEKKEGQPKIHIHPEIYPEIHMPHMHMGMGNLKKQEFIDLDARTSGMMIASEGIGPEDAIDPLMTIILSILKQMPKNNAQEFCRYAALTFANIAITGDIKLYKRNDK